MININLTTEKIKVEAENYVKVTSPPLYQYDYGQKLYITGLGSGLLLKAHFFNKKSKEAIARVGTTILSGVEIPIPDELIKDKYDIHVFIYYEDGVQGKTIGNIEIPIIPRAKPDALFAPNSPSEQKLLEEAIKAVQKQVDEDFTKKANQIEENVQNTLNEATQMYEDGITEEELYNYIDNKINSSLVPLNEKVLSLEASGDDLIASFDIGEYEDNVMVEIFALQGYEYFQYCKEVTLSGSTITMKFSSSLPSAEVNIAYFVWKSNLSESQIYIHL